MTTRTAPADSQPGTPPRRGRPRKGSSTLTRDAVVAAAISVIDDEGVEGVSMRTVARRLGVDPKSLYNYVDGKDNLLDAVAEHILVGVALPEPTGALDADLRAIGRTFRAATLAHPRAGALVLTRQLSSSAGLQPVATVLSVLRTAGCGPEEAVHLLRTLLASVIGTLLREVAAGPTFGVVGPEATATRQRDLEASQLPVLVEAAPHLARFRHDEEFEYALDLIVTAVTRKVDEGHLR
ncbi:TetR/AcrR family transcriptional regulator C-terminal domain-containing protein [Streptomyces sp. NBC_00414]|uniref:TetR/AcrR family transcriptional regulator n=1 Tax=Streptomyces sp. NBC_00414 TaxID=2975739 RepID=UPI002E209C04